MNEKNIGVLIIYRATNQTVMFEKVDYIRVGSYTKKLNEYPALQAQVWDKIRNTKFEERYAKQDLELANALRLLDFSVYFDIRNIPQPSNNDGVAHYMAEEGIIVKQDNGLYAITNLGAILFAKRLVDFPRISRKAIRVVQYHENNRLNMLKENVIEKGYVIGFEGLIKFIEALLQTQKIIASALREKKTAYPSIAGKEAVASEFIKPLDPTTAPRYMKYIPIWA